MTLPSKTQFVVLLATVDTHPNEVRDLLKLNGKTDLHDPDVKTKLCSFGSEVIGIPEWEIGQHYDQYVQDIDQADVAAEEYEKTICSVCRSNKTYVYQGYKKWHQVKGKGRMCHKCYCRHLRGR